MHDIPATKLPRCEAENGVDAQSESEKVERQ